MKKRAISLLLALVMILGILPVITLSTSASIATSGPKVNLGGSADRWGKPDMYWETEEAILETPLTVEAVIKHPSQARNGGYIFANYPGDSSTPSITFGINNTGRPQVYIVDTAKKGHEFIFYGSAFPYAGPSQLTHMAFVIDPVAKTVSYYQNGVLIETKQGSWGTLPANMKYRIGTDFRPDGSKFFQGALNFVAVYDEPLTAEQIKASHDNATWTKCDSLIGAWDLTKQGDAACYDRSGNGNTLIYNQGEGVRIDTFGSYTIQQPLSGIPETVEAWIFMPASYTDRGGTLIGNYGAPGSCYFSYEIQYNGNPRCFFNNGDGTSGTYAFTTIDVRKSKWMHVAFVHDPANNQMHCYIDGVLTESVESTISFTSALTNQYCMFGGDRQGNGQTQRFVGYIKEMRVYSDTRTAAEVASDYAGTVDYTDENIVLHYDLRNTPEYTNITDLTGNGNDVVYNQVFYGDVLPVTDYAYSIAVVGDTQTVAAGNRDKLKDIYQWIIDNKDDKKIQYVIGLGDITEHGEDWGHKNNDTEAETAVGDAEWQAALEAISMMDGKLPYSLIRGAGHDGVERFNEWFGDHEGYTSQIDGYYQEGRIENVYHTFKIGEVDYLVLCLDFGAKDPVLAWANEVAESHPNHRIIVTTHGYLEKDGSLLETGEAYCPSQSYYDPTNNDGDDIWDKFVRKHPNICMVMCGHMTASDIVVSKKIGDCGNEVTQILIDPQGLDTTSAPRGMVAMLYFSEDGTQVDAQYYSTITDMYRPNSSFTVTYEGDTEHTMEEEWIEIKAPTCTEVGTERRDCTVCAYYETRDVAALDHDRIQHEAQEPTCTEDGWHAYETCSRCSYTTFAAITTEGHDIIPHDAKEPTCTEIGWYAYETCSACDYTTYIARPKLDHDMDEWVQTDDPTCTEVGTERRDCTACAYYETRDVAALDHDRIYHDAKAATFTEKGWVAYETCSRCSHTTYAEIPATSFTAGETDMPDYAEIPEGYVVIQNQETLRYGIVENTYFQFLGGSLRYADATDGYTNIRFGYKFESEFELEGSNWKWNYGVAGSGLTNEKVGESYSTANRTNLVITNVPSSYFADELEVQLSFEITVEGVTYTIIDRVRTRSVLEVATAIVNSPTETVAAKAYAQSIVDSLTAG